MTPVKALVTACVLASVLPARAEDCFAVKEPIKPEVRLTIQLTQAGVAQLGSSKYAFLHVRRPAEPPAGPTHAVRMLNEDHETLFTFARTGDYWLSLNLAEKPGWPQGSETGTIVKACGEEGEQRVTIPSEKLPSFAGTRAHAWVTYRPMTRFETGASVYVNRAGFAAVFEVAPFADSDEPNRWNAGADVRWRGARGYLGGGVRYFPDEEPNKYRWRPVFVAGEELPAFKHHPIWFLFELRVEREWEKEFWNTLRLGFGMRIDLTRDQP